MDPLIAAASHPPVEGLDLRKMSLGPQEQQEPHKETAIFMTGRQTNCDPTQNQISNTKDSRSCRAKWPQLICRVATQRGPQEMQQQSLTG